MEFRTTHKGLETNGCLKQVGGKSKTVAFTEV